MGGRASRGLEPGDSIIGWMRNQATLEEQHIAEVDKMMRKPGELHPTG